MILFLSLVILVLILVASASTLAMRGAKRYSWIEYYMRGREAGLGFSDSKALKEAAILANLPDPSNVLWSPRDLDRAIALLLDKLKAEGKDRLREGVVLMDKIYSLRKFLELDQPRYKYGIKSSRHINEGQRVRILVPGLGVFDSTVVDNHQRYLVVSYPSGSRMPKDWVWKGKKVSVYFWRREDAGYVFDSYVIDDLSIRKVPVLQVSHSESLLRTQKRKSIRASARIPGYLYLLKRIEGAYEKPERAPGLKALIQDLSEDGVAVAIGGKAKLGLLVKIQFALGERNIVMSGTVRSIDYDVENNRSVLHLEAVTPSPRTRNAIRSYVYNVRAESDSRYDEHGNEASAAVSSAAVSSAAVSSVRDLPRHS
jgi:c-di-GMP-binding flagellar brake protein YcgR